MKSIGAAAAIALTLLAVACAKNEAKPRQVSPGVIRDVPSVLRGTIGSEATLMKAEPVLVSGFGLVVGLPDTGGGDLDARIEATMARQLGLRGISKNAAGLEGTPFEGMSPEELLRSRKVAVVVVYAAVIPGAPIGATFDVYVRAINKSPDISLEGGTLWTTDLQVGPPTLTEGIQTRKLATARGPIFVNPFAEPGVRGGITRNDGRILNGGVITNPVDLDLVLDNESHSRAASITRAINNRFPAQPGEDVTARGRTPRIINVAVPSAYRERSQEFLKLLTYTRIDQSQSAEYARQYVDALKAQPFLADELSWALQALPQKAALPFLRDLYDSPQEIERRAALRAGAGLGDPLAAPALKQMAREGPPLIRADAITLLGRLNAGPTVDLALQEQLSSDILTIRVAAYEALAGRAERVQVRRWLALQEQRAGGGLDPMQDNVRARLELPGDTIQGVRRRSIEGKFLLDIVPAGQPLIYVSQQGRPRIVLFGPDVELRRPLLVSAWGGEQAAGDGSTPSESTETPPGTPTKLPRLMLVADSPTDEIRIMYRYPDRIDPSGDVIPGRIVTSATKPDIASLVEVLARKPSPDDPRPGFGMTYSEVVGAIYAIQRQGGTTALFAVEDDVLKRRLLQATNATTVEERPETEGDKGSLLVYEPVERPEGATEPVKQNDKPSLVVPLPQPIRK